LEVVFDSLLDYGHIENAVDTRALARVLLQAHLYDVFESERISFWQGRILMMADLDA